MYTIEVPQTTESIVSRSKHAGIMDSPADLIKFLDKKPCSHGRCTGGMIAVLVHPAGIENRREVIQEWECTKCGKKAPCHTPISELPMTPVKVSPRFQMKEKTKWHSGRNQQNSRRY
jgi:hypothetical protein